MKAIKEVFVSNHPLIQHKLALMRSVTTEPKKFREVLRATEDPTVKERVSAEVLQLCSHFPVPGIV